MALRHLALKSENLEATKRFYVEVLGLREAFGPKRFGALGRRLKAAGVKVVGRWGRRSIYIKDPNGYTVELYAD